MKIKATILALSVGLLSVACGDDEPTNPPPINPNNTTGQNNNNSNNQSNNNSNNQTSTNNQTNTNGQTNSNNNNEDPDPTCQNYCDTVMANCTGDNAQYGSAAECLDYCENVGSWEAGERGVTDGNSIACRIYHGNAPAADDPVTHCVHAGPTGGNMCGTWCDNYCQLALDHCTGDNELYGSDAECQTACAEFDDSGNAGDTQYDTVQCRIYHGGAPAATSPEIHCPHAGEEPTDFCLDTPETFRFKTNAPSEYTRVDRMGMPAISTAVISSAQKNAYNDANPADDANGNFVADITANVTALHLALDDDLAAATLTPCVATDCVNQAAPLVVPDTLKIDTTGNAGFPNGRRLTDPVIDVTLAVVLLDLNVHAVTALVGVLNPTENDLGVEGAFLSAFPYLHPPHEL